MNRDFYFQWSVTTLVIVWLMVFAFIPHLFILVNSILPLNIFSFDWTKVTLRNYYDILSTVMYFKIFGRSILLAGTCTTCCLIIAYPFAYFLPQIKSRYESLLFLLIIIPFWTSSLIRTYAIVSILKAKGIFNAGLLKIGLIQEPLQLLHTNAAVVLGLVYDLLPFMIIPLYTSFKRLDHSYIDAARDLGASRTKIFLRVIIPLTLPGILSGSVLVFLPAMSLFYIPDILGGAQSMLLGNLIQQQFLREQWPRGSALSVLLVVMLTLLLWLLRRLLKDNHFYENFL